MLEPKLPASHTKTETNVCCRSWSLPASLPQPQMPLGRLRDGAETSLCPQGTKDHTRVCECTGNFREKSNFQLCGIQAPKSLCCPERGKDRGPGAGSPRHLRLRDGAKACVESGRTWFAPDAERHMREEPAGTWATALQGGTKGGRD